MKRGNGKTVYTANSNVLPTFVSYSRINVYGSIICCNDFWNVCTFCIGSFSTDSCCCASNGPFWRHDAWKNILCILCVFPGFIVTSSQIPVWLRWLQWIDLFKFGFTAASIKEFHNNEYFCTKKDLARHSGNCPITNGSQKLDQLGIDPDEFWLNGKFISTHTTEVFFLISLCAVVSKSVCRNIQILFCSLLYLLVHVFLLGVCLLGEVVCEHLKNLAVNK